MERADALRLLDREPARARGEPRRRLAGRAPRRQRRANARPAPDPLLLPSFTRVDAGPPLPCRVSTWTWPERREPPRRARLRQRHRGLEPRARAPRGRSPSAWGIAFDAPRPLLAPPRRRRLAGLVILVMSATGVLLAYERQTTAWADGYRVAPPSPDARASGSRRSRRACASRAGPSASITLRADPRAPAGLLARTGPHRLRRPLHGRPARRGVEAGARVLPRRDRLAPLARRARRRAADRQALTGASNLLFLFIVLSGIVLWWPKGLTLAHLRPITAFQRGLAGKPRDFNWHNVFGFWSAVPLAFVVASGVVISYPWANDLAHRLAGSEPPRRGPAPGAGGPGGGTRGGDRARRGLAARASIGPGPGRGAGGRLAEPEPTRPPLARGTLGSSASTPRPGRAARHAHPAVVDRRTGEVVKPRAVRRARPPGASSSGWLRFIHTGEAFGLPGRRSPAWPRRAA